MKFHPIKHCTLDEDVECNGEASLSSNSDENLECPKDYGMFVYPADCHKYVFCVERIPELLDCPNKQVYQDNVGCVEGKECPKVQSSVKASEQSEKCLLPPEKGPCNAKVIRYYYDVNTGRCKKFFYGGCQGNGNNFETMLKCEVSCYRQPVDGIGSCRSPNSIYRDPTDCRRYTRCINFIPHPSRCPAGEGYSSNTNGCVNLKDSDCKTNSVIDIMDI